MKAILMSIQPKWCERIATGIKTIEVRKTAPKETPFRVYMYETKSKQIEYLEEFSVGYCGRGKVIGEFICDKVNTYGADVIACAKWEVNGGEVKEHLRYNAGACLTAEEMFDYSNGKLLRGLHISDLKIYDKPKELREFRKQCVDPYQYCQGCKHGLVSIPADEEEYALYHNGQYDYFDTVCLNYITRAPQSWCYVEEI